MAFASKRETTRKEDLAYSLLAIFAVNLPLLYGEGSERAFPRLQGKIMERWVDNSIFARPLPKPLCVHLQEKSYGLLASSSAAFVSYGDVRAVETHRGRYPYSMTHRGVSITLALTPWHTDVYCARLHCRGPAVYGSYIGIYLRRVSPDDQFVRVAFDDEDRVEDAHQRPRRGPRTEYTAFCIPQKKVLERDPPIYGFRINVDLPKQD